MSIKKTNGISASTLAHAEQAFETSPAHVLADSIAKNGIDSTVLHRDALPAMFPLFSDEIKPMKVTNQRKSGRCWIFAAANLLRYHLRDTLQIKDTDFELSQNYLMFWDKLEKANYFLESVLDTAKEGKDSRVVMWLFANIMADGGQWDMLVSLVDKYGVVPKSAMSETFHSSDSAKMDAIIARKLRIDGIELRKLCASNQSDTQLQTRKEEMISECYVLLCSFLGKPPKHFDFAWQDEKGNFHRDSDQTPRSFYEKYFGKDFLDAYISVINAPTEEKPFGHTYTVKYLGNVIDGKPIKYLNLPTEALARAASEQIRAGQPVWFGSDVGKFSDKDKGILDTSLFPYEQSLQISLDMGKGEMLDFGESCLTHAMTLVGVDIVDQRATKWKVENSWGNEVGKDGFFVMSADWFSQYVCQVVVKKTFLTQEDQAAYEQQPIELEPWDPIGALAHIF
ncbi:MAG TPA: aminopeptidase [Ruminococcaceae bacterium]|nr:aminopeptidase [Oscillospiraceae bacterium]